MYMHITCHMHVTCMFVTCMYSGSLDRHVAWMFNCIGHNNHRYFMVFIIYMWMGTCYVINCGWTRIFVLLEIRAVSVVVMLAMVGQCLSVYFL